MTDTPFADLVDTLLKGGTAPDAIVSAVRFIELMSRDCHVTERDKARDRQRRHRAKLQQSQAQPEANDAGVSRVTGRDSARDESENALMTLSKKEDSQHGKEESDGVIGRAGRNKVSRGTRMEPGQAISDHQIADAHRLGMSMQQTSEAWSEFVDYWLGIPGSRGCKTDWEATWRNRVRQVLWRGKSNGKAKRTLIDDAKELFDQAREYERAAGIGSTPDGF